MGGGGAGQRLGALCGELEFQSEGGEFGLAVGQCRGVLERLRRVGDEVVVLALVAVEVESQAVIVARELRPKVLDALHQAPGFGAAGFIGGAHEVLAADLGQPGWHRQTHQQAAVDVVAGGDEVQTADGGPHGLELAGGPIAGVVPGLPAGGGERLGR